MLRLSGVSVSIGPVGILRNVSLEIGAGRFAGLIGRNGAGKTTLLRTIMGIGYMPEDRRLVPGLTVEENILLPAWSAGLPDAAGRLERVYQAIPEVKEFRARRALQLSGGQQKLVALARAMMAGSRMLLLDEPFEGVAPVLARRLADVIAALRKTGVTVILSESSLVHARELLDQVFVIDRGEVEPRSSTGGGKS